MERTTQQPSVIVMALSPETLKECDRLRIDFYITRVVIVCDKTTTFQYSENTITVSDGNDTYTLQNVATDTPLVIELVHIQHVDQDVPKLAEISKLERSDETPDLALMDKRSSIASQVIARYFPKIDRVETRL